MPHRKPISLTIQSALPDPAVSHLVHSIWMLQNNTGKDVRSTLLPNGMVDLNVMRLQAGKWKMALRGIDTLPAAVTIQAGTTMYAIGFKLLAVECLLGSSIKDVLNFGKSVDDEQWQFTERDLSSLTRFCARATQIIQNSSAGEIDGRKKKLFELIYASQGSISVKELSGRVAWSSRQINRYFNDRFGISLKTYCNILRFGASFKQLSEGKLFPEDHFTDQNHFIKEIRKYAGVTPKELSKNTNDRFIDITAIKTFPF